jgi:hypothetical protein
MVKVKLVSAFVFKTAEEIEDLKNKRIENLEDRIKITEAKILQWYAKTKDGEFARHFGIETNQGFSAEKDYDALFIEKYGENVREGSVYPSLNNPEAVFCKGKWVIYK